MDQQRESPSRRALLEREHEVERVRAALRAVGQRSRRQSLVIEGAAGIGKSRLLEAGAASRASSSASAC